MKFRNFFIISVLMLSAGFTGCKKDREPNKIVYTLPIRSGEVVIPAYAVQEYGLLKRESLHVILTSLNQLALSGATLPLLTPANPNYTFTVNEAHIGAVEFTIQFQSTSTISIFPVTTSSATVKYVRTISVIGPSSLFKYTDNATVLTLATAGNVNSDIILTDPGTILNGLGAAFDYSLTFTIPSPGARVNSQGLRGGSISVIGTGPAPSFYPIAMSLVTDNNHSIDGSMAWEGQNGGIHVDGSGVGFVITADARIPFN